MEDGDLSLPSTAHVSGGGYVTGSAFPWSYEEIDEMFDEAQRTLDEEKQKILEHLREVAGNAAAQAPVLIGSSEIAETLGIKRDYVARMARELGIGIVRKTSRKRGGQQRMFTPEEAESLTRAIAERRAR